MPAASELIVQRDRAILDLDVVERESRRRSRWPRGEGAVHQVLHVIVAVARTREQYARPSQLDGIEHRRALPERSSRDVRDKLVDGEQRSLRRLVGDRKIADNETQPGEVEPNRFHGRLASERFCEPRFELRPRNLRDRDPNGKYEEGNRAGGVG